MRKNQIIMFIVFVLLLVSVYVYAEVNPALTAKEIVEKVFNRYDGDDQVSTLILEIDRGTSKKTRSAQIFVKKTLEVDKTLIKFSYPPEVNGFAYLSYEYSDSKKPTDQWIYMPATKRVMRIAGKSTNTSFMDSDFTYEDISGRHPDHYEHIFLGIENVNGTECHKIESTPLAKNSSYSKLIYWVDTVSYVILQAEMYDKNGELYKILSVKQVEVINNVTIPTIMIMKNVKKGSNTVMTFKDMKINQNLSDDLFTERSMKN